MVNKITIATIILIYLIASYFWPEFFLQNYFFVIILLLAGLIFFFELNLKKKISLIVILGTLGLFLLKILPPPFGWFLKLNLPLAATIGFGILIIFLFILIELKLVLFISKKLLKKEI